VSAYIYEFLNKDVTLKFAYVENYIPGRYEKSNNNAGYVSKKNSE
jgi:hypothetical protein